MVLSHSPKKDSQASPLWERYCGPAILEVVTHKFMASRHSGETRTAAVGERSCSELGETALCRGT